MRLKNFTSNVKEIAYRVLLIVTGAQIILGALWFLCNFTKFQAFPGAGELLEISSTWVLDDYVGIAYPCVLWLFQKLFGQWYGGVLSFVQLLGVWAGSCFFLDTSGIIKKREKRVFVLLLGGAYITTFPMVMQFVTAQLPYAFGLVSFFGVTGCCMILCKKDKKDIPAQGKLLAATVVFWCLGGLFLPEYIWIFAVPVITALVISMWRSPKGFWLCILLCAAVLLGQFGMAKWYQEPGSRGRMENSFSGALLRRCVWPNFERDYFFWSHNVKILYPAEDMIYLSCEPEQVMYDFGYRMEQAYGAELAKEEYMLMVGSQWEIRTKDLLAECLTDWTGYLCPQVAAILQLHGIGVGYSGWNYHFMSEYTPRLTALYWEVGMIGFVLTALCFLGIFTAEAVRRKRKLICGETLLCVLTVLCMATVYTMSASGMWDYCHVLPVVCLWNAGMVYAILRLGIREKEDA